MKIHFDADLETLKEMLMDMLVTAENMLQMSNRILLEKDASLVDKVYELEDKVNRLEVEIDKYAVLLIARHQPAATDLRLIVAVIKMSNQAERLGDLAVNVAKRHEVIAQFPRKLMPEELFSIISLSCQMVRNAMEAFAGHDSDAAVTILRQDDEVDALNRKILARFIQEIVAGDAEVETGIQMTQISKQYERIGDCATNIAEEVVYYLRGKNVKHHFEPEETDADHNGGVSAGESQAPAPLSEQSAPESGTPEKENGERELG